MKAKPPPKSDKQRGKSRALKTDTRKPTQAIRSKAPIPVTAAEMLERIGDGIVAFDAGMNYTYVNRKGGELLGRKPADLIGKNYWVEFPEAKGTPFANAYARALETQETLVIEDYYAPWDRWFENRIYPSRDGLSIFFSEITARKQTEEKLRLSEERFSKAFRNSPSGLVISRMSDSEILEVNGAFQRILGYEREELVGHSSLELNMIAHPEERERGMKLLREKSMLRDEAFELRRKSGEIRQATLSTEIIEIGGEPCLITIIQDITERKRAEAERDRLFNLSIDMLSIAGFDGYFKQLNPAWEKTLGWTNEELKAKPYLEFIHPEDQEATLKAMAGLAEGKTILSFDNRYLCKDGSYKWISWNSFPIVEEKTILAVARDITERKRGEEQLRQRNRALQTLSECNQALVRATDESQLLNEICRVCVEIGGYRMAWVGYAENDIAKSVRPVAQKGFEEGYLETVNIVWDDSEHGRGPTGTAIRTGQMCLARNIPSDPSYVPWRAAAIQRGYASSIALPLIAQDRVLGALNIYSSHADAFDVAEVNLLQELVGDLAYGIAALRTRAEHERAEEALRESEERFSTAFFINPAPQSIISLKTGQVLEVNAATCQLFGYSREEMIGIDPGALDLWKNPDEQLAALEELQTTGRLLSREVTVRRKSGEVRIILFAAEQTAWKGEPCLITALHDITERKRAEDALREGEKRLSAVIENSPDTIYSFDLTNRKAVFLNREEFCGYSRRELEAPGSLMGAVHPDDLAIVRENWMEFTAGKGGHPIEYRLRRKDGEYAWIEQRITVLARDAQGAPAQLLVTLSDITERKRTEEALRESEARYRDLAEQAVDGIVVADADGKIQFVNNSFCVMLGYTRDELLKLNIADSYPPDERAAFSQRLSEIREAGALRFERTLVRKDGSTFPIEAVLGRTSGGLNQGIVRDITERKKAEEELEKNERRFRAVVENAWDAVLFISLDRGVTYASPSIERVLGYSPSELIGSNGFELVHPDDLGKARDLTEQETKNPGRTFTFDLRLLHKNGDGRVFEVSAVSRLDDPAVRAIVANFRDITERKQAEEALRASEERYSVMFECAPFSAALSTLSDGRIVQVNEAFEKLFGFTRAELLGKTSLEVGFNPNAEQRAQILAELQTRDYAHDLELTLRMKSGESRIFLVNIDRVTIGDEPFLLQTAQDITQRKQAEESLRESESKFRALFDTLSEGVALNEMLFNEQGEGVDYRILEVNPAYYSTADYGDTQVVGNVATKLYGMSPEVVKSFWETHKSKKQVQHTEMLSPLNNKWFSIATSPVINDRFVTSFFDITERKQAEEELRLSRDRLAKLSRRLVETRESEARAIGRELHDQIGQILTAMKITLDLAGQLPADAAAKKIAQAQTFAADLLDRVSRLSLQLRPPMLDDLGLVPALTWQVNRFQEETGIAVEFKHSGVEGKRFDPQIETTAYRVAQESLTNVARHARGTQVRLEVQKRGAEMEIKIEDNGVGFDPQAALALNRGLGGMRERVLLVGGTFEVESAKDKGARKTIRLPWKERA